MNMVPDSRNCFHWTLRPSTITTPPETAGERGSELWGGVCGSGWWWQW